jgi:uncharacterized protein
LDLFKAIEGLNVPALHVTGWWDGEMASTYGYYQAAAGSGAPQSLIVGPWTTAGSRRPKQQVGGFDFGPRSVLDMDEEMLRFFECHVRHRSPGGEGLDESLLTSRVYGRRAQAKLFITGRNEWVEHETWSETTQNSLTLQLSSTQGANTRRGDGTLAADAPHTDRVDTITDNPQTPVYFQPDFVSFAAGANPREFTLEQAHITARDEALVYTTAPLRAGVFVLGRPRVSFTVLTSAPDADLYVLLSDSFPMDSRDLHLSHAAIRLATLDAFVPGAPAHIELKLNAVGHEFAVGHRIRLTVTPTLYPLYARNPHAASYTNADSCNVVELELWHGPSAPAELVLPTVADGRR